MGAIQKPPILQGSMQQQITALRDYLFRIVGDLDGVIAAASTEQAVAEVKTLPDGTKIIAPGSEVSRDIANIRKNANELRDLIIKSTNELSESITNGDEYLISYVDSKEEEYNSLYLAKSEFGTFEESIDSRIQTSARGVVESYNYGSAITSMQDAINLAQRYYTQIDGEIRRGIVQDPDTGNYEIGIAISQKLEFTGECGEDDPNNPGDGYSYYYLKTGQTFGLYTSTGWQFWINGSKRGWFDSTDSRLHVGSEIVESELQIGEWEFTAVGGLGIKYVGAQT